MTNNSEAPSTELFTRLKKLKQLKEVLKTIEKDAEDLKQNISVLEAECVILMDNGDVTQVKIDGATMYRKSDSYASVDKENQGEAFKWLAKHKMEFLVQTTVNGRSLMAALKELPEDTLKERPKSIKISKVERVGMRGK